MDRRSARRVLGRLLVRATPGPAPRPEAALRLLRRNLRLVHGVGPALESRLARRGYAGIDDLVWHRRLAPAARWALDALDSGNPSRIARFCADRRGRSHLDFFLAANLHDEAEHVYFDLETLGLFSPPVILFGIARLRNGRVEVSGTWSATPPTSAARLRPRSRRSATPGSWSLQRPLLDVPSLAERAASCGLDHAVPAHHLDLLPIVRNSGGTGFPTAGSVQVEAGVLGRKRTDDLPSAMVPEFYTAYRRSWATRVRSCPSSLTTGRTSSPWSGSSPGSARSAMQADRAAGAIGRASPASCIAHVERMPGRAADTRTRPRPLPAPLAGWLTREGIRLYTHQVRALDAVREGSDVVMTTPTASGKTLAFTLPCSRSSLSTEERQRSISIRPRRSRTKFDPRPPGRRGRYRPLRQPRGDTAILPHLADPESGSGRE